MTGTIPQQTTLQVPTRHEDRSGRQEMPEQVYREEMLLFAREHLDRGCFANKTTWREEQGHLN